MTAIDDVIAKIQGVYAKWGKDTSLARMNLDWDDLFRHRAQPMTIEMFDAGGVPAAWIDMPEARTDRVLLYLHGGGFRLGSITSHLDLMQRLSSGANARVLFVAYRKLPEHRFPAPLKDTVAAYRWLLSQGFTAERIAFVGDSAGGGLAIGTMLAARQGRLPLPCGAVLMSPWVDMEASGAAYETRAAVDPMHSRKMILALAKSYLGPDGDPRDPLASPIHGDLHGLPPLLIQCGGRETVLDDSTALAARARAAGVDADLEIYEPMIHVFQMFAAELCDARTALASAGRFLDQKLSTTG
jgi:epsilon-lactone hydrolase